MDTIFVVEDNRELNAGICYALKKSGFLAKPAYSLREAKDLVREEKADLMLLDVNLPDGEGFSLCRQLGSQGLPVLFLTARDLEEDVLLGYELGAQDYITKPFSMKVLLKKIEVVLKRKTGSGKSVFNDGFLKVDFDRVKVYRGGRECSLTPTEFRILKEFISHGGQLLTYEVLLERLWDGGGQYVDKHALAVNIGRLRGKIEDGQHKYISNVYGMGYQWLRESQS